MERYRQRCGLLVAEDQRLGSQRRSRLSQTSAMDHVTGKRIEPDQGPAFLIFQALRSRVLETDELGVLDGEITALSMTQDGVDDELREQTGSQM